MPIEIKELHIKINVNGNEQSNAAQERESGGKAEKIVQTAIEEIMRIESRKKER